MSARPPPAQPCSGRIVILELTPFESAPARRAGPDARLRQRTPPATPSRLVYFNNPGWAKKQLPLGETKIVAGKLDAYGEEWQIVHPGSARPPARRPSLPLREPVYPLTEGITNRRMRELALAALERAPELPEWIEPRLLSRARLARLARVLGRSAFTSRRR